jgi:hypothetical protein
MVNLEFRNFWPGIHKQPNILFDHFQNYPEVYEVLNGKGFSKLVYESVFTPPKNQLQIKLQPIFSLLRRNLDRPNSEFVIWLTGENLRPPLTEKRYHHFLSFDEDEFGGMNTYFPIIYFSLNPYSEINYNRLGIAYSTLQLLNRRKLLFTKNRSRRACIISSSSAHREAAVQTLRKYMQVDVYGKMGDIPVKEKYSVARNYEFMICFENDLYPGYVTEKLVEAYVCETVPLYWGDLGRHNEYINTRSFINLFDFSQIEEWAYTIASMTDDDYWELYSEPLLHKIPPIEDTLSSIFKKVTFEKT